MQLLSRSLATTQQQQLKTDDDERLGSARALWSPTTSAVRNIQTGVAFDLGMRVVASSELMDFAKSCPYPGCCKILSLSRFPSDRLPSLEGAGVMKACWVAAMLLYLSAFRLLLEAINTVAAAQTCNGKYHWNGYEQSDKRALAVIVTISSSVQPARTVRWFFMCRGCIYMRYDAHNQVYGDLPSSESTRPKRPASSDRSGGSRKYSSSSSTLWTGQGSLTRKNATTTTVTLIRPNIGGTAGAAHP